MTDGRATHLSCPTCGATISAASEEGGISYVTCPYCKSRVAVMPGGSGQPSAAAPPAGALPGGSARRRAISVIAGTAIGLMATGFFLVFFLRRAPDRPAASGEGSVSHNVVPVTCGGDDRVTVDGMTRRGDGTLILATGRCGVTVKDANLASTGIAIVAMGDSTVTVRGSVLSGSPSAVTATANARVAIADSTLEAREAALIASGHAFIRMERGSLKSPSKAFIQTGNARILLVQTDVTGGRIGQAEEPQ